MKRKIAIIGTGYVGLTTGVCLAYLGHKITCVDKDKVKIRNLKKGIIPIYEPGLKEVLEKHKRNIEFTTDLKSAVSKSEIVFIAVGTPSNEDGSIDMSYFKKAVREIACCLNGYKVIVNKSTVPVGTGDWTKREMGRHFKGEFSIVSNPEFLKEGSALKDFLEADRIVIGAEDKKAKEIMLDVYSSINSPKVITDVRSAEMIKYASNAFLATKISFINEIATLCERTGGNIEEVSKGIGYDKRIGKHFLRAGIGFGGSCFPKDVDGLVNIAEKKRYNFRLLKSVAVVNKNQQIRFVKKIKKALKKIKGKTVCIWGLSFKPKTDDVRKSPAIGIIKRLYKDCNIKAYDPVAIGNAKKELSLKKIKYYRSAFEAAKGADILVLVTEWPEFSEIDMKKVKSLMRNSYFFDGRNQFNPDEMRKIGFSYYSIGRK